jgi:hypothetical protein
MALEKDSGACRIVTPAIVANRRRPTAALLGFMAEHEAVAFQQHICNLSETVSEAEMRAAWAAAAAEVARLPAFEPSASAVRPLSAPAAALAAKIESDPDFQRHLQQTPPFNWVSIEIDQLRSAQQYVDTAHVESLTCPPVSDEAATLEFCMRASPIDAPLWSADGKWTFSSVTDQNLEAKGFALHRISDTQMQVCAVIDSRPNYMFVADLGEGRYVLANGYHRTVALQRAGHTRIPCFTLPFERVSKIYAGPGFFTDAQLDAPRPPLVADYSGRPGVVHLDRTARSHILRVALQVEAFDAPA